jgi:hypothetical protein
LITFSVKNFVGPSKLCVLFHFTSLEGGVNGKEGKFNVVEFCNPSTFWMIGLHLADVFFLDASLD